MNLSGISDKAWLGRLLRFPLRYIPVDMKMPILQGKLIGKRWIVGSGNHGCWLGSYEYEKRRLFERIINRDAVVYDVGANAGFYTLLASCMVGSKGKVVAFEPLPKNVRYLEEHLRINQMTNVVVIEAAVSDSRGATYFKQGANSSMGQIAQQGDFQVKMVCLDDLVSRSEIPIPTHIKIDVEGAEFLVLSGAKSILANNHPTLFLATHGPMLHNKCCQLLETLGYELQPIKGRALEETDEILAVRKREKIFVGFGDDQSGQ